MTEPAGRVLGLRIVVDSAEELSALRGALLGARATELAEIQRRSSRLSHGYGSDSAREAMATDTERLRLRKTMLDRLIAELEAAARHAE